MWCIVFSFTLNISPQHALAENYQDAWFTAATSRPADAHYYSQDPAEHDGEEPLSGRSGGFEGDAAISAALSLDEYIGQTVALPGDIDRTMVMRPESQAFEKPMSSGLPAPMTPSADGSHGWDPDGMAPTRKVDVRAQIAQPQ
jgi:hypothetical protein